MLKIKKHTYTGNNMSIYHDLEAIKLAAIESTKHDGYNYNIILSNPNDKGEFDLSAGSTYEFVADSYFNKPRPNVKLLYRTKDLIESAEVDRMIGDIMDSAKKIHDMRKEMADLDIKIQDINAIDEGNKLKKGLSVIHAEADGVTYKQGKYGMERLENTNRNDRCNCGSGKKFKKCCGK